MISCIIVVSFLLYLIVDVDGYSFVSIGDWGANQIGGQFSINVNAVASQMATTATNVDAKFVINTGDNFYWCGIQNTSDPQIANDYEIPYNYPSLKVRWYSALGNHEYGYNVQAQIDYTKISSTWYMPARYYTKRIQLEGTNYATLLFLDTSPCYSPYRSDNIDNWDPCMTEYPTCSQKNTDDDFEGPCMFHSNIMGQDCSAQYSWLKSTLQAIPKDDWLIVVGHHPADEIDVKDFTTLLQQRGFSIYLNGHAHTLTLYSIDNANAYVTTGAGAMVDTMDQEVAITKAKTSGLQVTSEMRKASGMTVESSHTYQPLWNGKVAGFTLHSFNTDYTQLTTQFIKYDGTVLKTFVVNKAGKIVG